MNFFDQKEDVLDIELTNYGRHLLSQGKWKPTYYAFFDEGVVYDSQHIGYSENKNSAESRIQNETPTLKSQTCFTGREEFLFDGVEDILDRVKLSTYEKLNVMPQSLGSSALDSTKTPAYRIRFLEGKIKDLDSHYSGSIRTAFTGSSTQTHQSQQTIRIPQLDLDVEYKIAVRSPDRTVRFEDDPTLQPGRTYPDGAQVKIGPEQLLMIVEESGANFDYKNFDIEVYEITEETGPFGEEVLNPLRFRKPLVMVENNLLLDMSEAEAKAGRTNGTLPPLDPSYVEYYFDINVDSEIDENLICNAISKLRSTDFLNDLEINCPDLAQPVSTDIYASDAMDEDCPEY